MDVKACGGRTAMRVLIVVPNLKMLACARKNFAEMGVEIITSDDTAQAIEFLKHHCIDLISPEAFMEDDDLFAFMKEVRALPGHLHTPIWVVARNPRSRAFDMSFHVGKAALMLGADRFLIASCEDVPRLVDEFRAVFNL
jgi:DNA-binding response OmpR family regulator